jgi:hypothetical protein
VVIVIAIMVVMTMSGIISGATASPVIPIRRAIRVVIIPVGIISSTAIPVGVARIIPVIVPIVVWSRSIPVIPAKSNADAKSETEIDV